MISRIGRRYAMAVLSVAEAQNNVGTVLTDFSLIESVIKGSRELTAVLRSPIVKRDQKGRILQEIFKGKVSDQTLSLLSILSRKGREAYIDDVARELRSLIDEKNGLVTVEVRSAVNLGEIQSEDLRKKLETYTAKKIRINFSIDKELIGGLSVQIGDTVIDGSVKHKLEQLRQQFTADILN